MHISDLAEGKGLENDKRKRRDGAKRAAQTLLDENAQT
jgi:hypothetical protein